MPDIVIVGAYVVDFSCYLSRFPKPGETLCGTKLITSHGGKGANQCISAARLGASTGFVASLGGDNFGKEYIEQLKRENVDISKIQLREGVPSDMSQITVTDNGENTIIFVAGANKLLSIQDIDAAADLIKSAKVLLCQFEVQPPTPTLQALKIFKEHGAGISILNGAPAMENVDPELLRVCDIFCVNETEAEMMTGIAVTGLSEAQQAVDALLSQGCNTIILTLGASGAVYASQSDKKIVHVPTEQVKAIDTTGAGDAFLGSFAYFIAYHPNLPMKEKVKRACYVASQSVLRIGTQENFPYKKDLPANLFLH